jgi:hypothetical protein
LPNISIVFNDVSKSDVAVKNIPTKYLLDEEKINEIGYIKTIYNAFANNKSKKN